MVANRIFSSVWRYQTAVAAAVVWSVLPCAVFAQGLEQSPFAKVPESKQQVDCEACDPEAAAFDQWENLIDDDSSMYWEGPPLRPFDWLRHFGYRHSSTDGRHVDRGAPLKGTSWQNRPYHFDWFLGTLMGDEIIQDRVTLDNQLLGGFRLGVDFDYFWGIEWRTAWSNPSVQYVDSPTGGDGGIFMSDVDVLYYPWGDSKVRPYGLIGMGLARYDFIDNTGLNRNTTLATMPLGVGVKIRHLPWLAWRFEALDNISFGSDGVSSVQNISLTAGMELHFGARPNSYWPWRSSRRIW